MKTIEQLLALSKNPYYEFTDAEKVTLDDFLDKSSVKTSTSSVKKNSDQSYKGTRVRVRNIVEKTIPDVEDAPEPSERR
jgi:hypothetical protein